MSSHPALIPEFFLLIIFTLILICSLPISTNSLTLDMVRRDSFDLNIFPKNISDAQKSQIFAQLSHSRARRLSGQLPIVSKSINGSTYIDRTIKPTVKQFFDSLFGISVDIGSRPRPYRTYLALDTGSDLVWVQCLGCKDGRGNDCFRIKNGAFNQTASSSYQKLKIQDDLCKPVIPPVNGSGSDCRFEILYGTGHVLGVRSLDSFQFPASDRPFVTLENMMIGCADTVVNLTFGKHNMGVNNVISGIFGLALGYERYNNTFMALSKNLTGMKFSYCLPPWTASKSKVIPLSFGNDVPRLPHGAQITPMQPTMYFLNVNDISIGRHRLHLDPNMFRRRRDGNGGFMIDSGCGATYLINPAYQRVEHEMIAIMDSRKNKREDATATGYTLCYKWPLKIQDYPSLTYHMEHANLEVEFNNLFTRVKVKKGIYVGCMTIMPVNGLSLLGAAHQADYRFVYDLEHESLRFHKVQCYNE